MVPWPIALLSLFYTTLAVVSAATLWKILTGESPQSLAWAAVWFGLSAGLMCGLPLLKPWARRLAVYVSWLLVVTTLAIAGVLVAGGRPLGVLWTTVASGMQVLVIRYLRRPTVRAWFERRSIVDSP